MSSVLAKVNDGDIPWPKVVASALDTPEDRRVLQGIWPDVTLDAATGDSMVQIFRYIAESGTACLRCLHAPAASGPSYEQTMADRTGMSVAEVAEALAQPLAPLEASTLNRIRPEVRALAEEHVGSDICGF